MLPVGELFHDRYHVLRCIAAGGMGAVYEVQHIETQRHCALKIMLPDLVANPEMRSRFQQEARVTAAIDSEHLVQIFDAGIDETLGVPFIVMELLKGEDLGNTIEGKKAIDPATVVELLKQVALALDKTHAAGIVHRDLKPENLFLTKRDDGSPWVKVLDFGIAKIVANSDHAKTTRSTGTPMYMAPEQILGTGTVGPAADLYALAHIAYALLTGSPYWTVEFFVHGASYPFLTSVLEGPRELPTARAQRHGIGLPESFDPWFLRASAVEPEARHERATDMIAELAVVLGLSASGSGPELGAHEVPLWEAHTVRTKPVVTPAEMPPKPVDTSATIGTPAPSNEGTLMSSGRAGTDTEYLPDESQPQLAAQGRIVEVSSQVALQPSHTIDAVASPQAPPTASKRSWWVLVAGTVVLAAGMGLWVAQLSGGPETSTEKASGSETNSQLASTTPVSSTTSGETPDAAPQSEQIDGSTATSTATGAAETSSVDPDTRLRSTATHPRATGSIHPQPPKTTPNSTKSNGGDKPPEGIDPTRVR